MNSQIQFRSVTKDDLNQITEIYNQGVDTPMSSFDNEYVMSDKFIDVLSDMKKGVIVAIQDQLILGWSSVNPYLRGSIQQYTCYGSTFIRKEFRGQQLGAELLFRKFDLARQLGYKSIIAEVLVKNKHSMAMCISQGYKKIGIIRQITQKHEVWLNCQIFQKIL